MKLVTKYYIELSTKDKISLLQNARYVNQGISAEDFIYYIETMLNGVVSLIEQEQIKK